MKKRCIKRGFAGIHDRFQNDPTFRESLLSIDWTEEVCIQMDKDAQKGFTYRMSQDDYFRYKKNWWISLNNSGRKEPTKLRSDFNEAVTKLHRLHQESGEERLAPIPSWQYQKWHPSSSSSSTSWWQWNDSWWSSWQLTRKSASELMKEQQKERWDPLCRFFQTRSEARPCNIFFDAVRSLTADRSLLQPTEGVNSTPHTSHFSQCCTTNDTHTRGSRRKFGVRTSRVMCHPHSLMCLFWFSSTTPLSSLCCPSSLLSSCLSCCDVEDKFPVHSS